MANDRIKGISIEINGDTTDLQKALKDVNKEIKSSQTQLKDLEKLLKVDPGNTELLSQKYKALGKEIEGAKGKLDLLKQAEQQMQDAGQVGTAEWDGLQREIAETEQNVKSLTSELQAMGEQGESSAASISAKLDEAGKSIQNVGNNIKNAGEGISKVGGTLTKGVTLPITAIGTAAVAAFKEVDAAMDTVTTKTGASGEALEEMQKSVENIAGSIPTSFQSAADAVGEVNTRFGLTGTALEELSTSFIQFAEINGTDVSGSIDKVQSAMTAFNIPASDAGNVLDLLNVAGQNTGISLDSLSQMLTSNASALKAMGFNISDSAMLLANLSKQGIDASSVMAGLKKAYADSLKNGTSLQETLKGLETGLQDNATHADAAAQALSLFGTKAGGVLVDALTEGRLSFDQLGTSLSGYAGSVEATFSETLDPLDQMQSVMNSLKTVGNDLVTTAGPMITDMMQGLADIVRGLSEAWGGLSEDQQQMIIKLALIAAAVGPVISVVGSLTSSIGSIVSIGGKLMSGLSSLWGVLSANPILLVVAAVAALVAGFLYLWNNCEGFREFWTNLWDNLKQIVSGAVDGIKNFFSGIVDFISNNWQGLLLLLVNPFAGAFKLLYDNCDGFREFVDGFVTKIKEFFSGAWDSIKETASTVWTSIKDNITGIIDGIKNTITEKIQAAKDKVSEKLDGIKDKFSHIFEDVKLTVSNAIDKIKGFFNFHWELPKIKLPHFSISGKFSLDPPSIPHLSVEWYKKAMNDGMILNQPTIFGASGGNLLGAGEAGPEAVVGASSLSSMIQESVGSQFAALANALGGDTYVYIGNEKIDAIIQKSNQRINLRSGGR